MIRLAATLSDGSVTNKYEVFPVLVIKCT